MAKTEEDRKALLVSVGLDPEAGAKLPVAPKRQSKNEPVLAPEGVDPHTMPVTDIVFDERLLDDYPDLRGMRSEAATYVFKLYKSPGRNKERNRPLWNEIGLFITRVQRSRKSGVPHVKQEVRKGSEQRDLLALLNEMGVKSVEDLKALTKK